MCLSQTETSLGRSVTFWQDGEPSAHVFQPSFQDKSSAAVSLLRRNPEPQLVGRVDYRLCVHSPCWVSDALLRPNINTDALPLESPPVPPLCPGGDQADTDVLNSSSGILGSGIKLSLFWGNYGRCHAPAGSECGRAQRIKRKRFLRLCAPPSSTNEEHVFFFFMWFFISFE